MTVLARPALFASLSLLTAPLLLGAKDGCTSEVAVGRERPPALDDEGVDAGGASHDAGDACAEAECGVAPRLPTERCSDGSTAGPICGRDTTGECTWVIVRCPAEGNGDGGPCSEAECQGPWVEVSLAGTTTGTSCADGSAPHCTRTVSGLCEYQCAPEAACGTKLGAGCADDQFCAFTLGSCGPSGGAGGLCQQRPSACTADYAPVCGCDGTTYGNGCAAAAAGVSIAFAGTCVAEPPPCPQGCPGPAPGAPNVLCPDGVHESGPACLAKADGTCSWQLLTCPSTGACGATLPPLDPGRCFTHDDCTAGTSCDGASLCPCDAVCFAPDTPGFCK